MIAPDTPVADTIAGSMEEPCPVDVLRLADVALREAEHLLEQFSLNLVPVPDGRKIPGSHWGDDEAGLIGKSVYARLDTPVHSLLHETCHLILMDSNRRQSLHTNAGGTLLEECAVCYLQVLLADQIHPMTRSRMFADMDRWGYSFRLGSSREWFTDDAADARDFLHRWLDSLEASRLPDEGADAASGIGVSPAIGSDGDIIVDGRMRQHLRSLVDML